MIKPRDYEQAFAAEYGTESAQTLEPGGYGCVILKAENVKDSYGEKLVINFDIKDGTDKDGYFRKQFSSRKERFSDAKWGGVFRQPVYKKDGSTNPFFRGLVTAIEKSNPGFKWNFDETTLTNKKVGFVFREEEYKATDGSIKTTVRAAWACEYSKAAEMPVPPIKRLKEEPAAPAGFVEVQDDGLPFD